MGRRGIAIAVLSMLAAGPALATDYPLVVQNCGVTQTFERAPERVVAIKSSAAELLLALGQGEKLVGMAFLDGAIPDNFAAEAADIPILSEKLPSQEVVLETEPDLIYGGWESNFSADGAGERATLQRFGIASYVTPAACRSVKPEKLTFEHLFEEIAEMGEILDAEIAAADLVAAQRTQLAGVIADNRELTAVWYSSGTKAPYVGAGTNAPAMMMEALGLENIFAGVDEGWTSASWEAIVDANPDVIVLVDAAWNSGEQKKQLLATNPITSKLDAVVSQRYLVVPFPASEAGIRNVPAVLDMAQQLSGISIP